MTFPDELQYTKDHEWVRLDDDGGEAVIGITDFAQRELGDIVFVELERVDADIGQHAPFGTVEAVKTVSELYMPVSGRIIEVNDVLETRPEVINDDPYGDGWMIRIAVREPAELDGLMDAEAYREMVGA